MSDLSRRADDRSQQDHGSGLELEGGELGDRGDESRVDPGGEQHRAPADPRHEIGQAHQDAPYRASGHERRNRTVVGSRLGCNVFDRGRHVRADLLKLAWVSAGGLV